MNCPNGKNCECFSLNKQIGEHDAWHEYDCYFDMMWFCCVTCHVVEVIDDEEWRSPDTLFNACKKHTGSV